MKNSTKSRGDALPRVERKSPNEFAVLLSDSPIARSQVSRDKRSTRHYAADGTLVRIDAIELSDPIPDPIEENVFMSLTQAAEELGTHPSTIRRVAARGTLRTRRIGSNAYTTPAWLREYASKRRPAGRPRKSA